MPELPEVETVMRGLRTRLEGRRIAHAEIRRPDLRWPIPPGMRRALEGQRVLGFRRRGKYILMRLDGGMSALTDPRRFGALDLVPTEDEDRHRLLAGLGPEPLEDGFTGPTLETSLRGKRTPLKAALLDQTVVAGLGNIYVCEALFRARLSPRRLAGTIGPARASRLVASIRTTLADAVAAGGSSLRDYVQTDGELGWFQHSWKVYGRAGAPCERCPGPATCPGITRFTQAGRSTFSCPRTQR